MYNIVTVTLACFFGNGAQILAFEASPICKNPVFKASLIYQNPVTKTQDNCLLQTWTVRTASSQHLARSVNSQQNAMMNERIEQGLKIFCYALVRDPAQQYADEQIADFERNLVQSCDGWSLFSMRANKRMSVIKAYPNRKKSDFFVRNDTFLNVWTQHLKFEIDDFNFFVKLDADAALRPARFRQMLMQHDARKPVVLSVEECHPNNPRMDKDGVNGICVDGYFVAVSQAAARRILALKHPEDCRLAAFGDFEGNDNDEQMLRDCFHATGILFEEPIEQHGYHQIPVDRPGCPDMMPIKPEDAQTLASGRPLCGSVAAHLSKACCYSPDIALFHRVKTKADWHFLQQLFISEGL